MHFALQRKRFPVGNLQICNVECVFIIFSTQRLRQTQFSLYVRRISWKNIILSIWNHFLNLCAEVLVFKSDSINLFLVFANLKRKRAYSSSKSWTVLHDRISITSMKDRKLTNLPFWFYTMVRDHLTTVASMWLSWKISQVSSL